jgi:type II secretory pathway component PulF
LVLPAMVVAVLLTIALVRYVLVSRRAVALDVFAVIGSAMRQNLPLEAVLAGEVMVQRGLIRRVLHRVGRDLQGGSTLAAALDKHFPHCPGYALAAVAVAEPIHQLPAAVERVQERIADEARARDLTSGIVVYPLLMLLLMGGVMGTVGTFVLPSFASIFSDMGADVPLQRWWDPVMDYSRLVTTVIVLVLLPATLYLTMRPRRPSRPWFFSRVGDWLRWHVPLIRGSARNEAMMETTAFLRMALAAGRPLHEAAADAAELDVNLRFRRRLRQWAQRLQRGEDPADAVRAAQVGEALAFAFDGRVNGGDPQSVLEMVENGSRGRYQLRKKVLQQTVAVLVILTMAAFVTVVILAAMLPLVRLQEILME